MKHEYNLINFAIYLFIIILFYLKDLVSPFKEISDKLKLKQ